MAGGYIELDGVSRSFTHRGTAVEALHDINIAVGEGEFLALVGRSGCGKSTLLRIVAGFLPADSGTVRLGGISVLGPGSDRGMLFQQPMLFPWLTVLQNTLFGPRAQGENGPLVRQRARDILEDVGLSGFSDHYPKQLSGGMMHRAAFARALMAEPKILLMDEPFGSLDSLTRMAMQQFLLGLWERHRITIILVTHDPEEAVLLADRVAVMASQPGRLTEVISIPLPRPRASAMRDSPEFINLRRQVREAVEHEAGGA